MKDVGIAVAPAQRSHPHALKSGEPGCARCGERVDADAPAAVRSLLEVLDDLCIRLRVIPEEVAIADCPELCSLLLERQVRQVIDLLFVDAHEVAASLIPERCICGEPTPPAVGRRRSFGRVALTAFDEAVDAPGFLVEEDALPESKRRVESLIECSEELVGVDPELVAQSSRDGASGAPSFNRLSATVSDQPPAAGGELVALRMSAEVVVVVEDKNACIAADGFPIKVRCGEPADSGADHDEVVLFASITCIVPRSTVA